MTTVVFLIYPTAFSCVLGPKFVSGPKIRRENIAVILPPGGVLQSLLWCMHWPAKCELLVQNCG